MIATSKSFLELTATDLMCREVVTIHRRMSLRGAAHLLRRADITGAPVVDEEGRCVGVLSAVDFLRWVEQDRPHAEHSPARTCGYQTQGRLPNGQEAVVCTLAEGACSLQAMKPITDRRRVAMCLLPNDVLADWQQVIEDAPAAEARDYMTMDVVTVGPDVPLADLARRMIDAHIHRVVVIDEEGKPVGIVSATDVLAAVAREEAGFLGRGQGAVNR